MGKNSKATIKRIPSNDPLTAREAFGAAFKAAGPKASEGYQIVREKVDAPVKAALGKMTPKGRALVYLAGLVLTALVGAGAVNGVARPAIAGAARAALGPSYRIQCQLPSGNFGVCPGLRK